MRGLVLAAMILAVAATAAYSAIKPSASADAASGVSIEPFVWQFDEDYPAGGPGDDTAPVDTVYLKTHDGTDWMSRWDQTLNAISGPEALRAAVARYNAMGIRTVAWFVPMGSDYAGQLEMARVVLDSGVDALYADIEPYEGFCNWDCAALAEYLWKPLHAERPEATLGVIYDPRPHHWEKSGLQAWMSVADVALPMCYWDTFVDQAPWNDPRGCIYEAATHLRQALAPGQDTAFIPILQGNTTPERMQAGLDAMYELGLLKVSIWRRGVVSPEVWATLSDARDENSPANSRRSTASEIAALRAMNPRTMEEFSRLMKLVERAGDLGVVLR